MFPSFIEILVIYLTFVNIAFIYKRYFIKAAKENRKKSS